MAEETGAPSAAEPMDAETAFLNKMSDDSAVVPIDGKKEPAPAEQEPEEAAEENQTEEAEGDEPEADDAEAEEAEEPTDEKPEDPEIELVENGETIRIPLSELKKGYSRQAEFTRNNMALAEKSKAMDSERQTYVQNLQYLSAELEKAINKDNAAIDWQWLKENDPATFVLKKEEIRERQEVLAKAQKEQEWVNGAIAEYESKRIADYEANQAKLLAQKLPDFADPKKSTIVARKMVEFLNKEGFSNEEIQRLRDHRLAILANKAMKYDNLQSGKTLDQAKVKDAPKFSKPGEGRKMGGQQKLMMDARRELKRTGSDDAALSIFRNIQT